MTMRSRTEDSRCATALLASIRPGDARAPSSPRRPAFPPVARRVLADDAGGDLDVAQVAELPQLLGCARVLEDDLVDAEGVELSGSMEVDCLGQALNKPAELLFVVRGDLLSGRLALRLGGHRLRLAVPLYWKGLL